MNNKLNSWWNPDLRPENIEDYEETYTSTNDTGEEQTQTETYKFIKLPIIINKVLSRAAFIWTHAGCVWYNRLSNRTVKDELDALNAKSESSLTVLSGGTVQVNVVERYGKIVHISFKSSGSVTGHSAFAKIPEGYRPTKKLSAIGFGKTDSGNMAVPFGILENGDIIQEITGGTFSSPCVDATYLTD